VVLGHQPDVVCGLKFVNHDEAVALNPDELECEGVEYASLESRAPTASVAFILAENCRTS